MASSLALSSARLVGAARPSADSGTRPACQANAPLLSARSSKIRRALPRSALAMELPPYQPSGELLELVIVGGGPAGLAVAGRVAAAGYKVVLVDPEPLGRWPNNYGVWCDEFEQLGLQDVFEIVWDTATVQLDDGKEWERTLTRPYARVDRPLLKQKLLHKAVNSGVTFLQTKGSRVEHTSEISVLHCANGVEIRAALVLDAAGFGKTLVEYEGGKSYAPGYQGAYGVMAEVESHPFPLDKMLFMDWRDSHLDGAPAVKASNAKLPTFLYAMPFSPTMVFLEETSLVKKITEEEYCLIPMGGELPKVPQRTLAVGGAAGLVHPSTGYMVNRALSTAPTVADKIVDVLDRATGREGLRRKAASATEADAMAAEVWASLWPQERLQQREFFCFGQDVLLKLDLQGTRDFFDSFFTLNDFFWRGFLSAHLDLPNLIKFGLALFVNACPDAKFNILSKGITGLPIMLGRVANAPFYMSYD
eukprot:jgi/Tetstr1/430765/TSEL_020550.t1